MNTMTQMPPFDLQQFLHSGLHQQMTLPAMLRRAAALGRGRFVYLTDAGQMEVSTQELIAQAERLHAGLRAHGLLPGSPVLIQIDHGLRFVIAFWGALLGGYVPAPLGVPESWHPDSAGLRKLLAVAKTIGPGCAILTDSECVQEFQQLHARGECAFPILQYEQLVEHSPVRDHDGRAEDLALLMFSSGSTGNPKGVQLSHANLLNNIAQIATSTSLTGDEVSMTWLPYHHDMGLILFHLNHAICGLQQYKVSSLSFMRDPLGYLGLLDRHAVDITGFPNFAFDHILRYAREADTSSLNLSRLVSIYNGAEPISPALCRQFVAKFAHNGLRQDVILAGYGIAEACVCAAVMDRQSEEEATACPSLWVDRQALADGEVRFADDMHERERALELALLGPPMDGMHIRVVSETGQVLPVGRVGALQMSGPNVTVGYYGLQNDERILGDGWVDTGDLGFVHQGRVVISGRNKDVIFVHGRNFFSHDLEAQVQQACGLAAGDVVVCATRTADMRNERIALFVRNGKPDDSTLIQLAQAAALLGRQLSHRIDAIVALPALPRTSSGKIQRFALAERLACGEYDRIASAIAARLSRLQVLIAPDTDLERRLLQLCGALAAADPDQMSVEASFIELLSDSLRLAEYLSVLQHERPHPACANLALSALYQHNSPRALATYLESGAVVDADAVLPRTGLQSGSLGKSQQELWFWHQFDGDSTRYHEAYVCTFSDVIDAQALQAALNIAVNRFVALRTVLDAHAHPVRQRILPQVAVQLEVISESSDESGCQARFEHLARAPFDFSNPPLHRFALWHRPGGSRLLMVIPHIFIDGWGWSGFLTELARAYAAAKDTAGIAPTAEHSGDDAPTTLDYYAWVESRRGGPEHRNAADYWRALFAKPAPEYRLGNDASEAGLAMVATLDIDQDRVDDWERHARASALTLNQLALTAFVLTMAVRGGQADVVLGVTAPGRGHAQAQDLVGHLANTLAIRVQLADCTTLWDVAAQVRTQAMALLQHQDFALGEFVTPTTKTGPRAPYAAAYSFLPAPDQALRAGFGAVEIEPLRSKAKLDLLLNIETDAHGWRVLWEYDRARFEPAQMDEWHRDWLAVMDLLCISPTAPVMTLSLQMRNLPLPATAHASRQSPPWRTVDACVDTAVLRFATRIAIDDGQRRLTYAEMGARLDAMAVTLREHGATSGQRVMVCQHKGIEQVLSVLAVIKAGAIYVPCDPDYPDARIAKMAHAAAPALVLAEQALSNRLQPLLDSQVIRISIDGQRSELPPNWRVIGDESVLGQPDPAQPLTGIARPQDPLYLHFTSGSSGEPKGILNSHASVCHLIASMLALELFRDGDHVPQLVSCAFEAYAAELFPTLAVGGCLHVLPPLRELSALEITRIFAEAGISAATLSPSYALQLARAAGEIGGLPALRTLMLGGEALLPGHVHTLREAFSNARICNLYGPTETTVHATAWTLPERTDAQFDQVLIGMPLPGKKVVLRDACGMLCPPGVAGEILIGGDGLAIGYWNDPARTETSFIELELVPGRNERWYRSGDLGVQMADGHLRFAGRLDAQLKINGQRVELEEVERALLAVEGIEQAAVLGEEYSAGMWRLVACCVGPAAADNEELARQLGRQLPAYMVPARFLPMTELPMTHNAKIDRRRLFEVAVRQAVPGPSSDDLAEPTDGDALRVTLRAIWAKVLRTTSVKDEVSFFAQGGDSILALELSSMLSAQGLAMTPKEIYSKPTILAQLELLVNREGRREAADEQVVSGSVALTPMQLWFFDQPLTQPSHWLQTVAIEIADAVDVEALQRSLLAVVNHHDQLRVVFKGGRRGIQQRVREPVSEFTLHRLQLDAITADERTQAHQEFAASLAQAIDLSEQSFVAGLICGTGEPSQVVLIAHHLVVDTVSWRSIVADLEQAYRHELLGKPHRLPRKTTSFQRYADLMQAQAEDRVWLQQAKQRWQPAFVPITDDLHCPPVPLRDYATVRLCLHGQTASVLSGRTADLGLAPVQDALLSIVLRGLAQVSGQHRLRVDLESHGRTDPGAGVDLTRTVGWCTQLYPLTLPLRPEQAPADTLLEVWRAHRALSSHTGEFGMLRYLAEIEELTDYTAPAVNFNYLGKQGGASDSGWTLVSSPVPPFAMDDPPPYAVIVQAWGESEQLVLELAIHPELAGRYNLHAIQASIEVEASALAEDCRRMRLAGSPLQFDMTPLLREEAALLPLGTVDAYPMTPMQEAMFFHTRQNPDSAQYHEQTVYRYDGPIREDMLNRAFAALIVRHQALRTVFDVVANRHPLQLVLEARPLPVTWVALDPAQVGADDATPPLIVAYLEQDRRQGRFDPAIWPLCRLTVFNADAVNYLVFCFHHIVLDGWSQAALVAELMDSYRQIAAGNDSLRPPLQASMREHVQRLAEAIRDEQAREFWDRRLAHASANQFPIDLPRPEVREVIGAKVMVELDVADVAALDRLAASQGVSANAVCLAAWVYFMHTLCGDDDIVTGMVSSGRYPDIPDGMQMLGCFLNTLPVRIHLDEAETSLESLTGAVQDFLNGSRPYDTFPLKEIVRLVQARQPEQLQRELFHQLYAFENYPTDAASDQGLRIIDGFDMTNYDLVAVLIKRGDSLRVMFEYAPDVLYPHTVARWLEQFRHMLSILLHHPQQPIAKLDLRPPEQRDQLVRYNNTARDYALDVSMHGLFEHQVVRTPDAIAVQDRSASLSYAQLDAIGNQVARALRQGGVGDAELVAVLMPRTVDAVAAFMAVLKAGAAYVPLDPNYPDERILGILADARIGTVLTCASVLRDEPALAAAMRPRCRLISMDEVEDRAAVALDRSGWSRLDAQTLGLSVDARQLAYIIFTSGSTGKPKGVMITHRAAVNTLYAINELFSVGPADRVLGFSSFCFDLSVYDMFGVLAAGARLELADEVQIADPDVLFALVCERGITIWNSVPTGMNQLVKATLLRDPAPTWEGVRCVMLSGEFIPLTLPEDIRKVFPNTRIQSLGGATEGSIWSIHYPIDRVEPGWKSIPYGRPLANQGYYVLSEGMQPCLTDQVGMLYITGEGVAAGYFNDPEKTAAAFVVDPLRSDGRHMIYRTGDIGRMRADGNIEILGRKDMQVKVRGYRIELGEVEGQLALVPGIGDGAVIVLREGESSQLVAFYTAPRDDFDTATPARFLATRLPDYMIPARFQRLAQMPLNSSGKLDRRQLPALLERSVSTEQGGSTPLQGELEQTIAAAWSRVLRMEGIGPEHNFYMLGGDSIMSLQVASVLAEFGIRIRPADLVRQPTVRSLAALVATRDPMPTQADDHSVAPDLAPAQRWFLDGLALQRPEYWHLSMELEAGETLDAGRLRDALTALVNRHAVLRWQWQPESRNFVLADVVATVGLVELDLSGTDEGSAQDELVLLGRELREGITMQMGQPLYAFGLAWHPNGGSRLILIVHHLLIDAVSWRVLIDELQRLYRDSAAQLQPRGTEFATWAAFTANAQDEKTLMSCPPLRRYLDRDWPAPFAANAAATEQDAVRMSAQTDTRSTLAFLGGANRALATQPQDLALAAVILALHKVSGQSALALELEHHGRDVGGERFALDRTIGWFTAFYPFALELDALAHDQAGEELSVLAAVKDGLRALAPQAGAYMAWAWGQPKRPSALAEQSTPQILFNYLGALGQPSDADEWTFAVPSHPDRSGDARRSHAVDISAYVHDGRLCWQVACSTVDDKIAERLLEAIEEALQALLRKCADAAPRRTSSDFPLLWPTAEQLHQLQHNVSDAYPLSAMQTGMFYATQLHPGTQMYHVHAYATLRMKLDVRLLEQALNRLAERHAILRTIVIHDGFQTPVQVVLDKVNYRVELLEGVEPQQFFDGLPTQVHDVSQWPNMVMAISRVGEDTYHFLQFFHHLLLDGWSNAMFFGALITEYDRQSTDLSAPAEVTVNPRAFSDFIEHQIGAGRDPQTIQFWRENLEGARAALLPLDRQPAAARRFRTRIGDYLLPAEQAEEVRQYARQLGCTISDILLGSYALLVFRLSGQQDATIGYCGSIRPAEVPGIGSAIGMFLNTIPLRLRWQDGRSAADQFAVWREALASARTYEHTPLTAIAEALGQEPARDLFGADGLRVLYTAENYPGPALPGNVVGLGVHNWHMTEFDFAFVYSGDGPDGVHLKLAWADDVLDASTVDHWFALWRQCLDIMMGRSADPIAATAIITDDAATQVECDIAHRWHAVVAENGAKVAIESDDSSLTYAKLDQRAAALAQRLHVDELGARPVLLDCAEAGWFGAGLMACLAGKWTFLALDPDAPVAQTQAIARDLQTPLYVLSDRSQRWQGCEWAQVVDVADCPAAAWPERNDDNPLAYLAATSGSSGEPKLVRIGRAALEHFLAWYPERLQLRDGERVAHLLGRDFDAALSEWLPALLAGVTVVDMYALRKLPADVFDAEIQRLRIDVLTLPASYFDLWASQPALSQPSYAPRLVAVGGAPLRCSSVRRWQGRSGGSSTLLNVYGPAEATIAVCAWLIDGDLDQMLAQAGLPPDCPFVPVGGPEVLGQVLDSVGLPAVPGVVGELVLHGPQLMLDYVGSSAAVAPAFWPSGDRAWVSGRGLLMVDGRVGPWHKYRGRRLYPESLAAAISGLPGIADAVVWIEDGGSVSRLHVAIVDDRRREVGEIRILLAEHVPQTLGAQIALLPALPLTGHGKHDLTALRQLIESSESGMYAVPADIDPDLWRLVSAAFVGRSPDPHGNFVSNGGDSLIALHLHSRLKAALEMQIDLAALWAADSLAEWIFSLPVRRDTNTGRVPPMPASTIKSSVQSFSEDPA